MCRKRYKKVNTVITKLQRRKQINYRKIDCILKRGK